MSGRLGKPIVLGLALVWLILFSIPYTFAGGVAAAAGLEASLCTNADLLTGKFQKIDGLKAGAKGFTLAVTSGYKSRVLVNLAWRSDAGEGAGTAKPLGSDALVLGPGQTKFVPFAAPAGGLAPGRFSMVLSVAGQKDQILEFQVEAAAKPEAKAAAPPAKAAKGDETVSQALTRVFATKEGPEAAKAGVEVIGHFFDKELNSPAGKKTPAAPKDAPVAARQNAAPGGKTDPQPTFQQPDPVPAAESRALPGPADPAAMPAAPAKPAAEENKPRPPVKQAAAAPVASGGLQLVLARKVDPRKAPVETASGFGAQDKKIYLAFKGTDPALKGVVKVRWLTEAVEGLPPGQKMTDSREVIGTKSWNTAVFMPPYGGFWPGVYRVEVLKEDRLLAKLSFSIKSPHETALAASQAGPLDGMNLALAALGGKALFATSQSNGSSWAKEGLIDGFGYGGENCTPACGWASSGRRFPQDIVFAFNQNREAILKGVVLDCESCSGDEKCLASLPRLVEVWTSTKDQNAGYTLAAARRLLPLARRQFIPLKDVKARYLKLSIKSNYGGSRRTQLAEVEILEKPGPDSVVKDLPIDLALPALGGSVIRYSSQYYGGEAVHLVDKAKNGKGWRSADGKLPQEFVFCIKNHGPALIDRLELDLNSGFDPASRPKEIAVCCFPWKARQRVLWRRPAWSFRPRRTRRWCRLVKKPAS